MGDNKNTNREVMKKLVDVFNDENMLEDMRKEAIWVLRGPFVDSTFMELIKEYINFAKNTKNKMQTRLDILKLLNEALSIVDLYGDDESSDYSKNMEIVEDWRAHRKYCKEYERER